MNDYSARINLTTPMTGGEELWVIQLTRRAGHIAVRLRQSLGSCDPRVAVEVTTVAVEGESLSACMEEIVGEVERAGAGTVVGNVRAGLVAWMARRRA